MTSCARILAALTIFSAAGASAGDWPAFRGPKGDGAADAKNVPVSWKSPNEFRWQVDLPRPGNGSAIVVGRRVFVTSAEDKEGRKRSTYCFSAGDGRELWKKTVAFDKVLPTHDTNPYAGTTPASDGKLVVVWHASAGLFAYDLDGTERWRRTDLGEFRHIWGYGTSPIFHDGKVILHSGPGKRIFLAAFSPADGRTIWSTEEPVEGDGSNTPDKRYFGSWATPVVAKVGGKDQLVLAMPTRVGGYDPEDGKLLWWCEGLRHRGGDLAYSSPLLVDDLCVMTGGYGGPALAFRLGDSGDLTPKRLWRTERSPQSIGTGVVVGKHVYRPNAGPGTIDCLDPANGKVLWSHRAAGEQWASMVRVGDRVYSTAQNGGVVVFRPDPAKYDQIARSELGDATNATPAAVDGMLVFRGQKRLICVGK